MMPKSIDETWSEFKATVGKHPEILTYIRENRKRIDTCGGHEFFYVHEGTHRFARQCECMKCGGRLDVLQAVSYAKGVAHGREGRGSAVIGGERILKQEQSDAQVD